MIGINSSAANRTTAKAVMNYRNNDIMQVSAMRVLAILLLVALILLYTGHYCIVAQDVTITEAPLSAVSFELLNSRDPIIIRDHVANASEFVKTVMAWQHVSARRPLLEPNVLLVRNRSKWLVVHAASEPTAVQIAHPRQPPGQQAFIDVRLQHRQLLILPFRWWVGIPAGAEAIAVDDPISFAVGSVWQ